ncbi:MAG TPA: SigE family RNA polymerase sigma factor [Acidimicrobiales bacterium]|nr:SigE family RNA polymerase sigma factor [Acidimicrobiales bacterium]
MAAMAFRRGTTTVDTEPVGEAVAQLHRDHYRSLVRLAALLLDDVGSSEEVVQDAFVKMQLGWGRLADQERAPAYLRSVVLNGARSRIRHRQVRARHLQVAPPPAPSAEAGALAADDHDRMVGALRRLPARQREAVVLRYYLDLSEAEMATAMRISAGSVKTHLHRGLAALHETLEGMR